MIVIKTSTTLCTVRGWARIVLNDGIGSIEGPIKANLHSAAKLIAKKFSWSQIDFMQIGDVLKDNTEEIGDETTWKTYLKTGRVPKLTKIGSTMAMFREDNLSEAYKGEMLIGWVDPKNKLILHPEGGRMGRFHTQVLTNIMPVRRVPQVSARQNRCGYCKGYGQVREEW